MSKEAVYGNGPVFVVGSPRSGTSILTWCLGQHPNILPLEESGWFGRLAVDLGVSYQRGSQFGQRSQLSALGVGRDAFFGAFGGTIDTIIHCHRIQLEKNCRGIAEQNPSCVDLSFSVSRSTSEPKSRWVDGTPEYSFHICELRKLFPNAKFVHIVRDVRSVVNSMLQFKLGGASGLVKTEQQAYEYWLNTVEACIRAERALGSHIIHRLRYDDLVNQSEQTLRNLLAFLGEPYVDACIDPLAQRINSSEIPVGFRTHDPRTDPHLVERALRLSSHLQQSHESFQPSPSARADFEADFSKRVVFAAGLNVEYASAQKKVAALSKRLSWCGLMLSANLLLAFGGMLLKDAKESGWSHLWLASSLTGMGIYAAIRRAGLAQLFARISGRLGRQFVMSTTESACSYATDRSVARISRKTGAD